MYICIHIYIYIPERRSGIYIYTRSPEQNGCFDTKNEVLHISEHKIGVVIVDVLKKINQKKRLNFSVETDINF